VIPTALLCAAFFSVVLVIYWATEKPKRRTRSEYTLPPWDEETRRKQREAFQARAVLEEVKYAPPMDLGVKNALTKPPEKK
jgi:hypothetical protein